MRLVITLLILNLVGGCLLLFCFALAELRFDSRGVAQITELDRAGVINHPRLAESFPALAANTRYSLGHWITNPAHSFIFRISTIAGTLTALNIILLLAHALHIRKTRND